MPQIYLTNQLKNIRQNRQRLEYLLNLGEKTDNSTIVSIQADNQLLINHVMLMWESLTNTDKKSAQSIKDDIDWELNEYNRILAAANRELNPELMGNWGKSSSQIALVMGFLLIWGYCFFKINYFPSGFSIGEILFLVFVSLGFGSLFGLCTLLLWASAFSIQELFHSLKQNDGVGSKLNFLLCTLILGSWFSICQMAIWLDGNQNFNMLLLYCYFFLAMLIICLVSLFSKNEVLYSLITTFIFIIIFIILMIIFTSWDTVKKYWDILKYPVISIVVILLQLLISWLVNTRIKYDAYLKIIFRLMPIILVLISFNSLTSGIFNTTFEWLGIKQNQVAVVLSEDDHKKVKALAKEQNLHLLFSCEDENQTILNHTNVLWNGMGEHILLGIPSLKENKNVATIEVKQSDSKILRGIQSNEGCTYHKFEKAFESGQAILDTDAKKELFKDMDNLLSQSKISLTDIEISAFSDLTPYKGKGMNNLQLSEKRANYVQDLIRQTYFSKQLDTLVCEKYWCSQISIKSMGNKNPISSCLKTGHDKKDVANCRADDRSVLIRLKWKVSNKK